MIAAAQRSMPEPRRPQRLQRPRGRGVERRPSEGAIYVGRPTIFANPFGAKRFGHVRSVILHRRWITFRLGALSLERLGFTPHEIDALGRWRSRLIDRLPAIAGCDLQCWCPSTSKWCHADTLLALANEHA
jgi:hypothetical protein